MFFNNQLSVDQQREAFMATQKVGDRQLATPEQQWQGLLAVQKKFELSFEDSVDLWSTLDPLARLVATFAFTDEFDTSSDMRKADVEDAIGRLVSTYRRSKPIHTMPHHDLWWSKGVAFNCSFVSVVSVKD